MIETIVKEYLDEKLKIKVYFERQKNNKDKEFLVIEKTSGSFINQINAATIAIQSYANSMYQASLLNDKVKKFMLAMPKYKDIGKVSLNSDYNFTDTSTKEYRYQAVFNITY